MAFVFRAKRQVSMDQDNSKVYLEPSSYQKKPNIYSFNSTQKKEPCQIQKISAQQFQSAQQLYLIQKDKEKSDIMNQIKEINTLNKQTLFGKQERFQELQPLNEVTFNFDTEKLNKFKKTKKLFQQKEFQYKNNHEKYFALVPSIQKVLKVKSILDEELKEYETKKKQILDQLRSKSIKGIDWKNTTKKTVSLRQFKQNQAEIFVQDQIPDNKSNRKNTKFKIIRQQQKPNLNQKNKQKENLQIDFNHQDFQNDLKEYQKQIEMNRPQKFKYQFFNSSVPRFQNYENTNDYQDILFKNLQQSFKKDTHNKQKDYKFGQKQQRFTSLSQDYNTSSYLQHQSFIKQSHNKSNIFIIKDQKIKKKKDSQQIRPQIEFDNQDEFKMIKIQKKRNSKPMTLPKKQVKKEKKIEMSQLNVQNQNISYNIENIKNKNLYLNKINKKLSFGSLNDRFNLRKYYQQVRENKIVGILQKDQKKYSEAKKMRCTFSQAGRFQHYKDLSDQNCYNLEHKWQKKSFNVSFDPNQFHQQKIQ